MVASDSEERLGAVSRPGHRGRERGLVGGVLESVEVVQWRPDQVLTERHDLRGSAEMLEEVVQRLQHRRQPALEPLPGEHDLPDVRCGQT